MDPLYPVRQLRHKFAKTVVNADDHMGKWTFGTGAAVGGMTLVALTGSLFLEDIPMGEVLPDKEMAVNAVEAEHAFSKQISDLAEARDAFFAEQDAQILLSDDALQAQRDKGNALKTQMESLVSRIVMADGLSETQAAELLEEFSDDVGSIEGMGFAVSDFGHLRESRSAVKADVGSNWNNIAQKVTEHAAEADKNDQTYPFRIITDKHGEEVSTGAEVLVTILSSMTAGLFGAVGGMAFVLLSMLMGDTRTMRYWAQDKPKARPRRAPYSGH